ncbi:MAG: archaellin/type IV pilin N-terminal domain-containing protein [Candidatus Bathyarchaeia archaeon]
MRKIERKAISPVIATIIIIAVTIAISLAVAAWLMGLWSGFVGGPKISASLINMTQVITNEEPSENVTVGVLFMNTGTSSDRIQDTSAITLRVGGYTLPCKGIYTDSNLLPTPVSIDPTPPGAGTVLKFEFDVPKISGNVADLRGSTATIEIRLVSGNTIVLTGSIVGVVSQSGGV